MEPAQMTPAWLTDALRERFPKVHVASVEVLDVKHGTNSHVRLRASYDAGGEELPETYFVKLPPLDDARRQQIIDTGMGRREAYFYRTLADRVSMRVPRPYVSHYDEATGEFVILIEDLTGGTFPDLMDGIQYPQAQHAMRDFAALHVRYEDPATREREAGWVTYMPGGSDFGSSMLQYGLDHHRERLTDPFAELAELYIARQADLEALWRGGETTVVQGDTHIGNMFLDGERPGFLDWGLIQLGPAMRDVAYFLCMTLSPETRRQHERALIAQYLEHRHALGARAATLEEAWLGYRVQAAYCVPAACPLVLFPEDETPEQARLSRAFLMRSESAVADLEARAAVREAAGF